MKKVLLTISLAILGTTAFPQGLVKFSNGPSTLISAGGQAITGTYYFALLTAALGTTDLNAFTFSGLYATNVPSSPGRILGGPATGVSVQGWAGGTSRSFVVYAWPASMGITWNPAWVQQGISHSMIASGMAGGVDEYGQSLPALAIFSASTINVGFDAGWGCLGPYFLQFTSWPTNQTVNPGEPADFYVSAIACPPPTFQWCLNGIAIPGATLSHYHIGSAQAYDAGSYFAVLFGDGWGSRTSGSAILTVRPYEPTILEQPTNQIVAAGRPVDFHVIAGGAAPLYYQWLFNGAPVGGANNSTLHFDGIQFSQAGSYSVAITNAYGAITSAPAVLSIEANPPRIVLAPWNRTVNTGGFVDFVVSSEGSLPLSFQWRLNGQPIAGATGTDLHLDNVQASQAGNYSVTVTNAFGTVTSAAAGLYVNPFVVPPAGTPVGWGAECNIPYVEPGAHFRAISAARDYSVAVRPDGRLVTWGSIATSAPPGLSNIVAVSAGDYHILALTADGAIVAWGNNQYGQCSVPADAHNVVSVAAGSYFSLALRADGRVVAWGDNSLGQLIGLDGVSAIAAGAAHSLALRTDGTVVAAGDGLFGQTAVPTGLSSVTGIAAGQYHSLAVKADGTVVAWGYNYDNSGNFVGESEVPAGLIGAVAVAAGYYHSLALKSDGTVVAWGDNHFNQCDIPAGLNRVSRIAGGGYHTVALRTDGSLDAWPPSRSGGSPVPGASDIIAIAAGQYDSIALKSDGTVLAGVWNAPGLSSICAVAAGGSFYLALRTDGTVAAGGFGNSDQTNVPPGLNNVIAIAAGFSHSLALRSDGTVVGWGGTYTAPADLRGVVAISSGFNHDLALKSDGTVVGWGDNNYYGQCSPPGGLTDVVAIAAGNEHSLALKSDGTVVAWGFNRYGVTQVPAGLRNVTAIAAGESHDLALQRDGTILAWGDDTNGQLDFAPRLIAVTAVAAGGNHSLALVAGVPAIVAPPQSQTAEAGAEVQFHVRAAGYPPLSYHWFFNGTALLPAETNQVLRLHSTQLTNSGTYSVLIGNAFGSIRSDPASLGIIQPVQRRSAPALRLGGAPGQPIMIEATTGLDVPTGWWMLDSVILSSAAQIYVDTAYPLAGQRYYRAWQQASTNTLPSLSVALIPAVLLQGAAGATVRLDYINQLGPVDAWISLATITLTNNSQEYFDTSSIGQPSRLYRVGPAP